MNRISGLAGAAALFVGGVAAAVVPACKAPTQTPYDEDGGGPAATNATATLTIVFAGSGSGTVSIVSDADDGGAADAGATCSAGCTESYPTTATVNLTTTAGDDSIFDGWTPDSCSSPLSMATNVTCTATFKELELPEGGDEEDAGDGGG